ncbi:NAD(P)H-hydrate dehydratase [Shewanella aestuarii]|uniref:Bifunctional NAD(P)H-hydrate repair enzyme n=1 Tax=Shewanella aestuarii TaxID=1028752 RepID=A0A6G9QGW6_9GAMM|nr:NAD(P)H-hydrate dehydratase [Shewanella aestuarii]QIR13413.1 NAD(P)H-hydrate dehydratase [Shewanella aestuarii]
MATYPAVLSAKTVREAEQLWALTHGGSTWPLMVSAATSFVHRYQAAFNIRQPILVVAGQGNNGGDGYYIAKLLQQAGKPVLVFAPFGLPKQGLDAAQAMHEYLAEGGKIYATQAELTQAFVGLQTLSYQFSPTAKITYPVVIDALLGSGLARPLSQAGIDIINFINSNAQQVYAVDVPSGLDADTGQPMPVCVKATATHSFIAYKPGLLTANGPANCGELSLDSLGVETDVVLATDDKASSAAPKTSRWQYDPSFTRLPCRFGNTHKSCHGNVSVIAGIGNMAGAAIIASRAALHAGAGRVYLQCDPSHFAASLAQSPEIMFADNIHSVLASKAVLVVGPGLGRSEHARRVMTSILDPMHCNRQGLGVLDADALRYLAKHQQTVANWVITPHEAEAADLLGISAAEVTANRLVAALALYEKYQAVVVLKGAGTIVAHQAGVNFCHAGTPAMATPGMGDCLAGMIAALIAQGLSAVDAAITAVNWHASVGYQLAQTQRVVLASDICQQLKLTPL